MPTLLEHMVVGRNYSLLHEMKEAFLSPLDEPLFDEVPSELPILTPVDEQRFPNCNLHSIALNQVNRRPFHDYLKTDVTILEDALVE